MSFPPKKSFNKSYNTIPLSPGSELVVVSYKSSNYVILWPTNEVGAATRPPTSPSLVAIEQENLIPPYALIASSQVGSIENLVEPKSEKIGIKIAKTEKIKPHENPNNMIDSSSVALSLARLSQFTCNSMGINGVKARVLGKNEIDVDDSLARIHFRMGHFVCNPISANQFFDNHFPFEEKFNQMIQVVMDLANATSPEHPRYAKAQRLKASAENAAYCYHRLASMKERLTQAQGVPQR
ncbi:hypothetical protein O181_001395 [Austropuccinia psidii MF-1]|uniref:Uncharacterized protein n=1 Tax=Austropuccinia psidii MF-1 TaxID=1389203 RepID=A0A9Q3GBS8_9BASI|nr:hypothetical protein [Austropuccinia psidii MF-1]